MKTKLRQELIRRHMLKTTLTSHALAPTPPSWERALDGIKWNVTLPLSTANIPKHILDTPVRSVRPRDMVLVYGVRAPVTSATVGGLLRAVETALHKVKQRCPAIRKEVQKEQRRFKAEENANGTFKYWNPEWNPEHWSIDTFCMDGLEFEKIRKKNTFWEPQFDHM